MKTLLPVHSYYERAAIIVTAIIISALLAYFLGL